VSARYYLAYLNWAHDQYGPRDPMPEGQEIHDGKPAETIQFPTSTVPRRGFINLAIYDAPQEGNLVWMCYNRSRWAWDIEEGQTFKPDRDAVVPHRGQNIVQNPETGKGQP
jgi:hypothetical protein